MTTLKQQAAPVAQEQEAALATAFYLLDALAGEGLSQTCDDGRTIEADDTLFALCSAFYMEPDVGWYRDLAAQLAPLPCKSGEGAVSHYPETYSGLSLSDLDTPPHPDDVAVDRFADRMKAKLAAARAKGRGGWDDPEQCTVPHLQQLLHEHLVKGDPVDVANFCMMLNHYGASTIPEAGLYPDNTYTPYGRRSVADLAQLLGIDGTRPTVVSVVNAAYSALAPDATQTREAELLAALEPFAEACNISSADDSESLYDTLAAEKLTWRDLRRARAAFNARGGA